MAQLTDLPLDLLHTILENLLPTGPATTHQDGHPEIIISSEFLHSRRSLGALARVCRSIHDVAQVYLYRVVLIKRDLELLLLFRTLATTPRLRRLVRSFFWACTLSHGPQPSASIAAAEGVDLFPAGIYTLLPHLEEPARECWRALASVWPATQDDILLYRLYLLTGPERLVPWALLGAVLGMIQQVKQLFMVMSTFEKREPTDLLSRGSLYPEHQCLERLLDPRGHGWALERWPVIDNLHEPGLRPGPFSNWAVVKTNRFLQEVESVTFDPTTLFHNGLAVTTMGSLRFLLGTSRRIRRFQLRGMPICDIAFLGHGQSYNVPFVPNNVTHLTLLTGYLGPTQFNTLVDAFPKLESLHVTPYLMQLRDPCDPKTHCGSLVKLGPTLRRLEWRTCHKRSPGSGVGRRFLSDIVGRLHMLQHLTTETVWLFSLDHPEIASDLAHMLPSSLESFHLIDAWGPDRRTAADFAAGRNVYHPDFPGGASPLEYFDAALDRLRSGCEKQYHKLRDIKLTSPLFAGIFPEQSPEVVRFIYTHTRAFANLGRFITFDAYPLETDRIYKYDTWAHVT